MNLMLWLPSLSPRLADPIIWIFLVTGVGSFIGAGLGARNILRLTCARKRAVGERTGTPGNSAPIPAIPAATPESAPAAAILLRQADLRPIAPAAPSMPKDGNPMRGFKTWCAHCKTPNHNALNCPRVRPVVAHMKPIQQEEEEYAV